MKHIHSISYAEHGEQHSGTPIICLHGIGGSQDSFLPQLAYFGDTQRILAWDMPGYGESALLENTSFSSLTQALLAFMDALEISQAHIIGHSIGGMIAQELALCHPQRVASLALLATTSAFGGRDEAFKQRFLEARLTPLNQGQQMQTLADAFVPQVVGSAASQAVIRAASNTMRHVPEASYRAIMQCLVTFNRYQDSHTISQPSCLIAGAEDSNSPAATMQKMAGKVPHAQYHELAQVGHLVNLEAADLCNHILRQFYTGLSHDSSH